MAFSNHRIGEIDEDPFFRHRPGPPMVPMGLGGFGGLFHPPQHAMLPVPHMGSTAVTPFGTMWPFGGASPFAHMNAMVRNMESMMNPVHHGAAVPGAHSYSSSSVMHYSSTGREGSAPRVFHASTSTRHAPGGITETRKSVKDSQTGVHKMAIGHHIGNRSHMVERQYNAQTREQEEHQEFVNLDETDARSFNTEWENRTRPVNREFHPHGHHHPAAIAHRRRQAETRGLPAAGDIIGPPSTPHTVGTDPNTSTKQTHGKRRNRPPSLSHDEDGTTEQPPLDSQEASRSSSSSHHHDRPRHKHARFQSPPYTLHGSQSHAHPHARRYHSPPPPPPPPLGPPVGEEVPRPPLQRHGGGLHASGGSGATKKRKGPVHIEL